MTLIEPVLKLDPRHVLKIASVVCDKRSVVAQCYCRDEQIHYASFSPYSLKMQLDLAKYFGGFKIEVNDGKRSEELT